MKTRQRWMLVIAAALLLTTTVIVLAQIMWAKRSTELPAEKTSTFGQNQQGQVTVGTSDRNDTSIPLRDMKQLPLDQREEGEANENPKLPNHHIDSADPVVQ